MRVLKHLFESNRVWADGVRQADPQFFEKLAQQQSPHYMWIGCSDSRVPANQIVGLMPGDMFVHRNVANVVAHTDLNCLSVLQFAVDVLKIRHVIVCGHYGCAGVKAVERGDELGLVDEWLRNVWEVRRIHGPCIARGSSEEQRCDRLCELNVIEQVMNTCRTAIAQKAWERGQELTVHGWIYGIQNGILKDLNVTVTQPDELDTVYNGAVAALD